MHNHLHMYVFSYSAFSFIGGNAMALTLKKTESRWLQSTDCSCLRLWDPTGKARAFGKQGFRSKVQHTKSWTWPVALALSCRSGRAIPAHWPLLGGFLCPKVAAALPSEGWGTPQPLLLLRCAKAWYGWSTFRSLQHVLRTDPGWQGSGQMSVFMLSAPQLNGLQPQTSLSALYQFHYMVILPPQHNAGNV